MDARLSFVAGKLEDAFGVSPGDAQAAVARHRADVDAFLLPGGPQALIWYYQAPTPPPAGHPPGRPRLFLSRPEREPLLAKALALTRTCAGAVGDTTCAADVAAAELAPDVLGGMRSLLTQVFVPMVEAAAAGGARQEVLMGAAAVVAAIDAAAAGAAPAPPLRRPGAGWPGAGAPPEAKALARFAADPASAAQYTDLLAEWCGEVERLAEPEEFLAAAAASLEEEVARWRRRAGALAAIGQQLASGESQGVRAAAGAASPSLLKRWREAEAALAAAAAQAEEGAKFLAALRPALEPLDAGLPQAAQAALPAAVRELRLAAAASRHFARPAALAALVRCLAAQLARRGREHVQSGGKLWDQPRPELLDRLEAVMAVHAAFQAQCRELLGGGGAAKGAAAGGDCGGLAADALSDSLALYRRCAQLRHLFATAHRFAELGRLGHVPGLPAAATAFADTVEALRRQPADLLDPGAAPDLDRDMLDFEVHLNDLELQVTRALRASFDAAASTRHALSLLRQYAPLLPAAAAAAEVDAMFAAAFARFGGDLEAVQRQYERHKGDPPMARGAPPVAGAVLWARGLLRRIEAPMQQFAQHAPLVAHKDSRRTIKAYNRLAQALLEFEALWHAAWARSAAAAAAPLQAPVLARAPGGGGGPLLVNLDLGALQLVREAQWLGRLGLALPESARLVLLRADALRGHHAGLAAAVAAVAAVEAGAPPPLRPLLQPAVEALLARAQPGLAAVTWNSANVDGFIHQLAAAAARAAELARRAADVYAHRVAAGAGAVAACRLLDLPAGGAVGCAEFGARQDRQLAKAKQAIAAKVQEVHAACEDVLAMVAAWAPSGGAAPLAPAAAASFRAHCASLLQEAVLTATKAALGALQERLEGGGGGGAGAEGPATPDPGEGLTPPVAAAGGPGPLLSLELQLEGGGIVLRPGLDALQACIAAAAAAVLRAGEELPGWAALPAGGGLHGAELRAAAATVERAAEGTQGGVARQLALFEPFAFLWRSSLQAAFADFQRGRPSLEESEAQLRRLQRIALDLEALPASLPAGGALALDPSPLKHALAAEAAAWKAQFASRLHAGALAELRRLEQEGRALAARLARRVEDLEDVRAVLGALEAAREAEAEFERAAAPVEEMYALLARHEVRVPKEEADALGDLQYQYRGLRRATADAGARLAGAQARLLGEVRAGAGALAADAKAFRAHWDAAGPAVPGLLPAEAAARLQTFKAEFEARQRRWDKVAAGEALFGLPPTPLPELQQTQEDVAALDQLYSLYTAVLAATRDHGALPWAQAVAQFDALGARVADFQAQARRVPRALREWPAYRDCRRAVDDLAAAVPLLQGLGRPAVRARHWAELVRVLGAPLPAPGEGLTLGQALAAPLAAHRDAVEELCAAAAKEEGVERKLRAVADQWAGEALAFAEHKQRGAVLLRPAETAELMERLEDSTMALGGLSANRFAAPFRAELQAWSAKLGAVGEVMERWLAVQAMWAYMEAVFAGGDIVRQLPAEAKRFQGIDRAFVKLVAGAREAGRVLDACCGSDALRAALPHLLEQLELCQKSLAAYLETKRAEFPRFYFVSDSTLLEILSLGSDPAAVVPHFQSGLFDSLSGVTFDPADRHKITEMWSREGERVALARPVDARGNVEAWLARLVGGMQETLKGAIRRAAREVDELELGEFLFSRPAQVALLGLQFQWTADTAAALHGAARDEKGALTRALRKAEATLRELVALALRPDLTKTQRTALETAVTVYIHQKEATEELVRARVRDPGDFLWLRQCRFAWREDRDTVVISICDVDLEYSYEYLGVKERLVITPLTDVCYVALTQALGMCLGGAPAGPAGTGKTETTKDLGATLGKYVVVFNCSDQMDHKGMGKIYKGLAQSGLWGCFDEFNRINLDVLSVCAQQVHCVLSAVRERRTAFTFTDGSLVPLDPRVGLFITMNPGYAGRQELPENLKALFRGVTMMVPNRQTIIKVKLAAAGYQDNDALAKKFHVLYGLAEQQLSKQPHYDFGLRNILSVLRTAGASKRASPDKSEPELMMRTLRDMNMSKLVAEDVPLFLALIDDLFPGQRAERAPAADVAAALERVCAERGLQAHAPWVKKCMELYDTTLVRHGVMVVGPPGSGKSAAVDCLAAALTALGQRTAVWRMNPKAITAPQMFGRMDPATGDWTDGVFSVLWRRAARAPKGQATWIVLDGPVDAVWIENLNTVLDDNKVLTLANGDRVLMTPQMRLIFEPENLANASPATVSRAGIIFFSDSELGWRPVAASWLAGRPEREAAALRPCFERLVEPALEFVRAACAPVMRTEAVCKVATLLTLLTAVLGPSTKAGSGGGGAGEADAGGAGGAAGGALRREESSASVASAIVSGQSEGGEAADAARCERHFLYCLAWGVGGLLDPGDRARFDAHLRGLTRLAPAPLEAGDTLFEFLVDDNSGEWQHWRERVPAWRFPAPAPGGPAPRFSQMIVPTLDSVRYERLLALVHSVGKASLLVGGPGTAKTCIVQQFLSRFDPDAHVARTVTFSSLTSPAIFQTAVEGAMEKRQGRTYGPSGGKSMALFVDDLAMPALNAWGDQITNELVRQLLEQGGFYSLDKPVGDLKQFVDTRYVAAMSLPAAGRSDIPNRLKRQFCVFNVPPPSPAAINGVFGRLMAGHFSAAAFSAPLGAAAQRLVPATMALWGRVQAKLLPTPAKFHYQFTLRDVSRVFQGVMLAHPDAFAGAGAEGAAGEEACLVALWEHECRRVFADKLVSPEDKGWVEAALEELCREHFGEAVAAAAAARAAPFVDFLRDAPLDEATGEPKGPRPSVYEPAPGGLPGVRARVEALVAAAAAAPGARGAPPDLVLFSDAVDHLARLSRVLTLERGSALLVGVGGSGKRSLARLAAHLAGAACFSIAPAKGYGVPALLEDLKGLYKQAALKAQPVCLLLADSDVKEESFLEYVNQVLMTGEVAGLFPRDELEAVLGDVRPIMRAQAPGVPDTWDNLYSFFINRVRDRLHVVLCFSPVGPRFARWAQQFPGLINGCTIDWFLPWPEDALTSVSSKLLGDCADLAALDPAQRSALQRLTAAVHTRVTAACQQYYLQYRRHAHVTPKSYIASVEGFKQLYSRKLAQLRSKASAIAAGLDKMNAAKRDVGRMEVELAAKTAELAVAGAEAGRLLAEISASTAAAERERAKVAVIVEAVRKKADEIAAVKAEAERDLAAAQPALEAALSALNSISSKDIVSLKALRSPPDVVKRIFDCVLLLRHRPVGRAAWQDVKGASVLVGSYEEAVKMMGDMNFLQALVNFPKEAINDETVELLQPYFAAPDFNFESAKKASGNVAGLCNWAEAMCRYHAVAKEVEPKIVKLRASEGELRAAQAERAAGEAELAGVQAALDAMQARFEAAVAHKGALEADAAATRRKMDNAATLVAALGGEEARWVAESAAFEGSIARLAGDCAVASSFVSYLGPFNRAFRQLLLADIAAACSAAGIPATPDLRVSSFLADDTEVGQWGVEGLPADDLSVQNGVLVTRATRAPLLVDPQGQGRAWLLRRGAGAGLRVTQLGDKRFRAALEEALAAGAPLLVEDVEEDELDPALDAVLERRFLRRGRGLAVALGDKEVEVGEGFRMFLTTRLPNPKLTPELCAKVTVVDFTVTPAGLEDQLLARLVLRERRELEEQRRRLAGEVQACRARVADLEADLLSRLSTSTGNLLDDTALIDVLAGTKATAREAGERLAVAADTRGRIDAACEEFRPAAHRATLLYFLVAEFAGINCMYQTSLAQFTALYEASITGAERAPSAARRVANIVDHLTAGVYAYAQRGLFERHKLVFALMMANKIQVSAGAVSAAEVDAFLKMGGALDAPGARKKPKDWLPAGAWRNVLALATRLPAAFGALPDSVAREDATWRAWYDLEAPEAAPAPALGGPGAPPLSRFQRLCLVRAFREDRALVAAADYVAEALGRQFVDSVPASMERAWEDSAPGCPVVCLLSPGADPTKLIEELAKRRKIKCLGVSMGQGQEVVARRHMAAAAAEGHWVLLQNTHLGLQYLSEVEQYLAKAQGLHEGFRLWITAEPHPAFPIGLLQMSLKVTNEAPVGLRAGLRASYQWVTQDLLDAVARPEWRPLLFALCFLHSVVQERRKFGPIGWNVPYEFNAGDLSACAQFLQNHVQDLAARRAPHPDWPTVRYMLSTIQYGGRITDDFDRGLMDALAERYFHEGAVLKGHEVFRDERTGARYTVPDGAEIEAFRAAVEALPAREGPEVFGLHPNADLTFRTLQAQEAVQLILDIQPKGGGAAGGGGRDDAVDAACQELLAKLPARFGGEETREALRRLPGGPAAPLTIHLRQEVDRLNRVLHAVGDTLRTLRLAVAGTVALGDELLECMEALFCARPPKPWLKLSWEAPSLGLWFTGLLQRHEQLHRWLTAGRPASFWLGGFFNPQGFLTAVKQEVTRRHAGDKWALDDAVLVSEVTRFVDPGAVREGPGEGVFVHGLSLEGCGWGAREGRLVEAEPKKLFCPLPVLHVTAVLAKDKKKSGVFEAPCYRVRRRTGANFVSTFMLRSDEERAKWVLRGVALLCSVD